MNLGLSELFKKAKPAELREVRGLLDNIPAPERPAASAEQRRTWAGELKQGGDAHGSDVANYGSQLRAAEARRDEAIRECERLYALAPDSSAYGKWRDGIWAEAWRLRSPLVDALMTGCRTEREALEARIEAISIPEDRKYMMRQMLEGISQKVLGEIVDERSIRARDAEETAFGQKTFSNRDHVVARARGLLQLEEQVRRWAERCEYATDEELQRKFDGAHRALPPFENAAEVAMHDPRGRDYLTQKGVTPSPRPAA